MKKLKTTLKIKSSCGNVPVSYVSFSVLFFKKKQKNGKVEGEEHICGWRSLLSSFFKSLGGVFPLFFLQGRSGCLALLPVDEEVVGSAHGAQLLGRGRVNADGAVEVLQLRTHLDRDGHALDDLRSVAAEQVHAHDGARAVVRDDLGEEALVLEAGDVVHERLEAGLVHGDARELLRGGLVSETHGADGGDGEHGGGDSVVVDGARLAEHGVRDDVTLVDGDGRQLDAVRNVAERPDVGHVRAALRVDEHGLRLGVERDADAFEVEAVRAGVAAGGIHNDVCNERLAILRGHLLLAVGLQLDLGDVVSEHEVHAGVLLHLVAQLGAHVAVEATQEELAAVHERRRLDAEAVEDARELDGDVAATDDEHRAGALLDVEGLIRRDRVLNAGHVGARRPTTNGDERVLGLDLDGGALARALLAHKDGVGVLHGAPAEQKVHFGVLEHADVGLVDAGDGVVLGLHELLPVHFLRGRLRPTEAHAVAERVAVVRGGDKQLLRHAADVHARAAERGVVRRPVVNLGLDDGNGLLVRSGDVPGGLEATGARTDHNKVVDLLGGLRQRKGARHGVWCYTIEASVHISQSNPPTPRRRPSNVLSLSRRRSGAGLSGSSFSTSCGATVTLSTC
eukprot:PhM_4_TR1301/c1_g1_i3/m.105370